MNKHLKKERIASFLKKYSKKKYVFFAGLFILAVILSRKVNLASLVGVESQFFTLFQLFGPIAGGVLGSFLGPVIVLLGMASELGLKILATGEGFELVSFLRFLPMVFAAYYFGVKRKELSVIIPIIAIIAFVAHPVGRQVWFFSLFWTIPIIAVFFKNKLFFRSLGATFSAHSVGGAVWIWTFSMPPEAWIALIPVVIIERFLFTVGIATSYIFANTLMHKANWKVPLTSLDKRYSLISMKDSIAEKQFVSKVLRSLV